MFLVFLFQENSLTISWGKIPQRFPPPFCAQARIRRVNVSGGPQGAMEVGYPVIQVLPTVDGSEIQRSPPGMVLKPCK